MLHLAESLGAVVNIEDPTVKLSPVKVVNASIAILFEWSATTISMRG